MLGQFFIWGSKVIRDCIGFALIRSLIGKENFRHSLNQLKAKLTPIMTRSPAFSRALGSLAVFTLSSLGSYRCVSFFWLATAINLVCHTTLNRKALQMWILHSNLTHKERVSIECRETKIIQITNS